MLRKTLLLILSLAFAIPAMATGPAASGSASDAQSITFTMDWPVQTPPRYSLTVTSTGAASYTQPVSSGEEPYTLKWTLSEALRTQIFDLAKEANYFEGKTDSKLKVAKTGDKTLSFQDAAHHETVAYNFPDDKSMQELSRIFQAIANTIQSGEKLEYSARFDRLGLNAQLKTLHDQQKIGQAMEIQAIQPVLQKIAKNRALMNVAQQKAAEILKAAGLTVQAEGQQGGG